ncbi:hypothetical protein ELY21_10310 [Legionella sp. km535]|uniref:hypothetical protein n=1 Tax=Legionella sp. km535 TaxID=2498107 RepID=UPI000F8C481B|nr:hypothetical protein [Legionella sp. km535]RUR17883.1 hypothetical protein ELY21_10310 [Legionella sp. km535]
MQRKKRIHHITGEEVEKRKSIVDGIEIEFTEAQEVERDIEEHDWFLKEPDRIHGNPPIFNRHQK